jgi:hypothetical protein
MKWLEADRFELKDKLAGQKKAQISGREDGLESGHVLAVYRTGDTVRDTIGGGKDMIKLPNERAGTLMVVRLFDNISYALVMEATRDLRILDTVNNP